MLSPRLRWLCRRGMRELDLMIGGYLSESYPSAEPEGQRAFERLLELSDDELWHSLSGDRLPEDAALAQVIQKIRASARTPS